MDSTITIITVVKDDDEGLLKTIASMDAQTCKQCEYLIINGGKPFGDKVFEQVKKVLEGFEGNNFVQEPDKGIYDAMNKGARLAHGDYVLYINAGDTLYDNSVIKNILREVTGKEIGFYVGDYCYVDWDGHENIRRMAEFPALSLNKIRLGSFNELYDRGIPHHNSTLTRRDLLLNYPYEEKRFPISADTRHFLSYARKTSVVPLPFIINRFVFGGASGTHRLEVLAEQRDMMMDATVNRQGVDSYIKSAILNEFRVQRRFGIKLADAWKIIKHYPIEALCAWWIACHPIKKKMLSKYKMALVIALAGGKCVRETVKYISSNMPNPVIAFVANMNGARSIRSFDLNASIEPIEEMLMRTSRLPKTTLAIVVTDGKPLTPAIKEIFYNLGIRKFLISEAGVLSKMSLKRPVVIGKTAEGIAVYEKGF